MLVKWSIAEIFKDDLSREGSEVFTVRADEAVEARRASELPHTVLLGGHFI